jgi:hypothetical protein
MFARPLELGVAPSQRGAIHHRSHDDAPRRISPNPPSESSPSQESAA